MTTLTLKSRINGNFKQHVGNFRSYNTYNVRVECEDNEQYDFEVDADTYGQACSIAESLAMEMYNDIIFIQVEQVA
jgi:hypothetical protein